MYVTDTFAEKEGALDITFIGHASLMITWKGLVVHVDPDGHLADYSALPEADLILITHEHGDHLDPEAIALLIKESTEIVSNKRGALLVPKAHVMHNGEKISFRGIEIEGVPAYNIVHVRSSGSPFHPKGSGNGYLCSFGELRVYIAGDTEDIPEMRDITNIDIAFLPMNLPFTMTPEMTARAARMFSPRVLYPYHYGETDPRELQKLLEDTDIDVRIRDLR